jgi:hypothetical protein
MAWTSRGVHSDIIVPGDLEFHMKSLLTGGIAAAALAFTLGVSSPAHACGGWFQPACPAPRAAPVRAQPAPRLAPALQPSANLVRSNGANSLITNDGGSLKGSNLINNGGSTLRR